MSSHLPSTRQLRARLRFLDRMAAQHEEAILSGRGDSQERRLQWRRLQNRVFELDPSDPNKDPPDLPEPEEEGPLKIYVAGPYTHGDVAANVRAALDVAEAIRAAGHVPFVPHLLHFWHLVHPHSYEDWMAICLEWVEACDALVRLPGFSPGADREMARADELGIPVWRDLEGVGELTWDYLRAQRDANECRLEMTPSAKVKMAKDILKLLGRTAR